MARKMTIDTWAEITANELRTVGKSAIEPTMKEGFEIMFDELRGLRDDLKQARAARGVEYAQWQAKDEALRTQK